MRSDDRSFSRRDFLRARAALGACAQVVAGSGNFHCRILEHQQSGMMAVAQVA